MNVQYVIAAVLIGSGALTLWAGPDLSGEKPDGTPGPVPPDERRKLQVFGVLCVVCGVCVLVATLLGYRAPPADGPGVP